MDCGNVGCVDLTSESCTDAHRTFSDLIILPTALELALEIVEEILDDSRIVSIKYSTYAECGEF